jgi:YD repeat-containing protein
VTRDDGGRILTRTEHLGGDTVAWAYGYDQMGRLTDVTRDGVAVEHYGYDANGNRLTEENAARGVSGRSYTYSVEDHLLTAGWDTYQFDVDGFLQGRSGSGGAASFSYSSRGELQTAWLPTGGVVGYVHDPLGRRIAKQVNGVTVEKYLWAGQTQLLAVYDGNDNLKARFVYADERLPVAMAVGGAIYTLVHDQVGSVRGVFDLGGNLVKRIYYDSFGSIIADSNPAFAVPLGFAGGLHDRDTGLVRFGARD